MVCYPAVGSKKTDKNTNISILPILVCVGGGGGEGGGGEGAGAEGEGCFALL